LPFVHSMLSTEEIHIINLIISEISCTRKNNEVQGHHTMRSVTIWSSTKFSTTACHTTL